MPLKYRKGKYKNFYEEFKVNRSFTGTQEVDQSLKTLFKKVHN